MWRRITDPIIGITLIAFSFALALGYVHVSSEFVGFAAFYALGRTFLIVVERDV